MAVKPGLAYAVKDEGWIGLSQCIEVGGML